MLDDEVVVRGLLHFGGIPSTLRRIVALDPCAGLEPMMDQEGVRIDNKPLPKIPEPDREVKVITTAKSVINSTGSVQAVPPNSQAEPNEKRCLSDAPRASGVVDALRASGNSCDRADSSHVIVAEGQDQVLIKVGLGGRWRNMGVVVLEHHIFSVRMFQAKL